MATIKVRNRFGELVTLNVSDGCEGSEYSQAVHAHFGPQHEPALSPSDTTAIYNYVLREADAQAVDWYYERSARGTWQHRVTWPDRTTTYLTDAEVERLVIEHCRNHEQS